MYDTSHAGYIIHQQRTGALVRELELLRSQRERDGAAPARQRRSPAAWFRTATHGRRTRTTATA